ASPAKLLVQGICEAAHKHKDLAVAVTALKAIPEPSLMSVAYTLGTVAEFGQVEDLQLCEDLCHSRLTHEPVQVSGRRDLLEVKRKAIFDSLVFISQDPAKSADGH